MMGLERTHQVLPGKHCKYFRKGEGTLICKRNARTVKDQTQCSQDGFGKDSYAFKGKFSSGHKQAAKGGWGRGGGGGQQLQTQCPQDG